MAYYSLTNQVYPTSGAANWKFTNNQGTEITGAEPGTKVYLSVVQSDDYYWLRDTKHPSDLSISGGMFDMPSNNVVLTHYYQRLATGQIAGSMNCGSDYTVTLNLYGDADCEHWVYLSYNGHNTTEVRILHGQTTGTISIPLSWCDYIRNAEYAVGAKLTVRTQLGLEVKGETYVNNLRLNVPASVRPSIGTITTSVNRTIGSKTYANIGNYYVQNHCGVSISTSASGAYASTITSMKVTISGYSGSSYEKTVTDSSISFDSGLLTTAGHTTIYVTATDTRGRTVSAHTSISVTPYNNPTGSITVWRVDANGNADPMGTYAKYNVTTGYTPVGSNVVMGISMFANGSMSFISNGTGDILPNNRKTFDVNTEYFIQLTIADKFETTTISTKLQTARYLIFASSDGNHLGFEKAATKSTPSGKSGTIEFSDMYQIYIGDDTLEQFIRNVVNNM